MEQAVELLRRGGVIAFPTETFYGLAVDPGNERALEKLYRLKGRHQSKPILVLVDDQQKLAELVTSVPSCYLPLIAEFWPGPLTLVFDSRPELSPLLTAGTSTLGVRISSNPVAADFVRLAGIPVTATSGNRSGYSPAVSPEEVAEQFPTGLDYIVDGGTTAGGQPSTIVGCHNDRPVIFRHGAVAESEILRCLAQSRKPG